MKNSWFFWFLDRVLRLFLHFFTLQGEFLKSTKLNTKNPLSKMTQVKKSKEQTALENRISRCNKLLRTMKSQLKSVRRRNRANREKRRRSQNVNTLKKRQEEEFNSLLDDIKKARASRMIKAMQKNGKKSKKAESSSSEEEEGSEDEDMESNGWIRRWVSRGW